MIYDSQPTRAIQTLYISSFRWDVGRSVLACIGDKVNRFLAFTDDGSQFMYGYLVTRQPFMTHLLDNSSIAYNVTKEINENKAIYGPLFFNAIMTIYFFSFVTAMLTYYGVVQVSLKSFINFSLMSKSLFSVGHGEDGLAASSYHRNHAVRNTQRRRKRLPRPRHGTPAHSTLLSKVRYLAD